MKNMKSKIKNQKQELKKLRLKLDQVTQETGIEVDEELTSVSTDIRIWQISVDRSQIRMQYKIETNFN